MTMQISDYLLFDSRDLSLSAYALDPFGGLVNSETIAKRFSSVRKCSACWRGYVATWMIDHNQLKLSSLTDEFLTEDNQIESTWNLIYELYPENNYPVFATWVNGKIEAACGNIIGNCGYYKPIYEEYYALEIENGVLISYNKYDGRTWMELNDCGDSNQRNPRIHGNR